MKPITKKLIISGTVISAVSIVAAAIVSREITKSMMNVALDRNVPDKLKNSDIARKQLLGSQENVKFRRIVGEISERVKGMEHETVEITGRDGERLVGHWFTCEGAERTVIAMHGWRSSWADDFGIMHEFLTKSGCNLLYAEQRGHDNSGGEYLGFGLLERHDCRNWIEWVNNREGGAVPIYLFGISMGAATVMMASDLDLPENVKGIISDCGFTSPQEIWMHVAKNNLHLATGVRKRLVDDICKQKLQMSSEAHSATKSMSACKIPVLFIHGTDDKFVPIRMTYENYKACNAPKELLVVPGADHGMSYYTDKKRYEIALLHFWKGKE